MLDTSLQAAAALTCFASTGTSHFRIGVVGLSRWKRLLETRAHAGNKNLGAKPQLYELTRCSAPMLGEVVRHVLAIAQSSVFGGRCVNSTGLPPVDLPSRDAMVVLYIEVLPTLNASGRPPRS